MPSVLLLQRDPEASPRLAARVVASRKFTLIGTGHTLVEARVALTAQEPDLLLTDLLLQDGAVHELLDECRARDGGANRPQVIATLMARDDAVLLDALRAGADGCWLHTDAPEHLIDTLRRVWRGESSITPGIARTLLQHFDGEPRRFDSATESFDSVRLTEVEREILQWLARGFLVDEIARHWHMSVQGIARGVRQVIHKLQHDARAQRVSLVT